MIARFGRSMGFGAVIAAFLVILADVTAHAAVVTAAAAVHESPARYLAGGFTGITAVATLAVFILLSVFTSRKPRWEGGDYPRDSRRGSSRPVSWEQDPPADHRRGAR